MSPKSCTKAVPSRMFQHHPRYWEPASDQTLCKTSASYPYQPPFLALWDLATADSLSTITPKSTISWWTHRDTRLTISFSPLSKIYCTRGTLGCSIETRASLHLQAYTSSLPKYLNKASSTRRGAWMTHTLVWVQSLKFKKGTRFTRAPLDAGQRTWLARCVEQAFAADTQK